METKYEYESGSQTLTRTTTIGVKRRDEKGKETEELFFTREFTDTFAGKANKDKQIKDLTNTFWKCRITTM